MSNGTSSPDADANLLYIVFLSALIGGLWFGPPGVVAGAYLGIAGGAVAGGVTKYEDDSSVDEEATAADEEATAADEEATAADEEATAADEEATAADEEA